MSIRDIALASTSVFIKFKRKGHECIVIRVVPVDLVARGAFQRALDVLASQAANGARRLFEDTRASLGG